MDPIGNINHLAEILRKQLAETQQKPGTTSKPAMQTAAADGRPGIEELRRRVREKMQRIETNDPKAEQKSIHVFLESVLLWEFGDRLMEDPKFYAMLDEVQRSMESDPTLRKELTTLVEMLR